ncbi:hypothetical protein CSC72_09435 [Pusillimonas noertemannii]|nr:hypothetical protein CSC72_09435 [Pusillimonas noertemannii]
MPAPWRPAEAAGANRVKSRPPPFASGRDLIIPEKKPIINPENAGLSEFKRIEAGCSEALKADFISHGGKKGH